MLVGCRLVLQSDLNLVPESRLLTRALIQVLGSQSDRGGVRWMLDRKTPDKLLKSRLLPAVERDLMFLLTEVDVAAAKRHQNWFATTYVFPPSVWGRGGGGGLSRKLASAIAVVPSPVLKISSFILFALHAAWCSAVACKLLVFPPSFPPPSRGVQR